MVENSFFDLLETRGDEEREAQLMAALRRQVAHAQNHTRALSERLRGIESSSLRSRADLARLPVIRKSELQEDQNADSAPDVFGGYSALVRGGHESRRLLRVFSSPGPIYEPEGAAPNYWRSARALFAAGLRTGDLVHNSFSYHFTPAGAMMETGAFQLGCSVFPAGTGQTEQQVLAMRALKPTAYTGTPSFLKIILEKAEIMRADLSSLSKASVSGEAFPNSLRTWLSDRGIDGYQSYATADLGLIAYETQSRDGLVVDEEVIVEIVQPGTGSPVPHGIVGEVVVTSLCAGYPLIRFGTGDLSKVIAGTCPTGRTNIRIAGWMGRADQSAKVRGMFVHPSQVAEVSLRHPLLKKVKLVIGRKDMVDEMVLHAEVDRAVDGLAVKVEASLRELTKLRGSVELCAVGSLPNDGKIIEDTRPLS
jgi:phenylacetate-CoA ligase